MSSSTSSEHPASPNSRRRGRKSHKTRRYGHPTHKSSQQLLSALDRLDSGPDRSPAVAHLQKILSQWVQDLTQSVWDRARPAVVPFGSCRLQVHRADSDLDVLALCPPSVSRDDFFASLVQRLERDETVEQVHAIPRAYTPVIKCVIAGIQVDMLFGTTTAERLLQYQGSPSLLQSHRPPLILDDNDLAHQIDAAGVRSLNGVRVSQLLLGIVPNLTVYRTVLRAVKEWAVTHGIYSNVLGFLGGINWAILVAFVCLHHPEADAALTLHLFFSTFCAWKWPMPVLLKELQDKPPAGVLAMPSWNPQVNPRDARDIMPIITPIYPSMNSSYNVGLPQLRRIQDELLRGYNLLKENPCFRLWEQPTDFFTRHQHYLQVSVVASNERDFLEWYRLVESKLRLLFTSLETDKVQAWPYAKFFPRRYNAEGVLLGAGTSDPDCLHESLLFVALRFLADADLRHLPGEFLRIVQQWEGRKEGMDVRIERLSVDQLPDVVKENDTSSWTTDVLEAPQSPDLTSPLKKHRVALGEVEP